jgi:hypothetical protein
VPYFQRATTFSINFNIFTKPYSASARISIKSSQGKGQGAVLAKKWQFASYKEKLEKQTEFHSF